MKLYYVVAMAVAGAAIYMVFRNIISLAIIMVSCLLVYMGGNYREKIIESEQKDRKVPDLLRNLSSFTSYGLSLSSAFGYVSSENYGKLTSEIRNAEKLYENGNTTDTVSEYLYSSTSREMKITSTILKDTEKTGRISEPLDYMSFYENNTGSNLENRISTTSGYINMLMISYMIFLFVIIIVDYYFISGSIESHFIYYISYILIVQGVLTGIVSGIIRFSSPIPGLFYSGILLFTSTFLLTFIGAV
ncbi:MAG: type II secretion system F family protein, partial [Thermoplasmata archaeon]